ncbi:tetratricopeptide repeat protein [Mucilaginibacter sp. dw_454]|uniref:tetratricopeptide repeat protein n=1 Tax=Mucilaginibacter sp. dw_454 TaxID=2720079 RepID=UPI001BD3A4B8|nr:tetratricopeptide repeat protein [Mucilaginibacter sp. dw_454]
MKKACAILLFILVTHTVYATDAPDVASKDTTEVISLNKSAYNSRTTNAKETIDYAERALALANKIGYRRGVAEAYRMKGIGEYYSNHLDTALNRYFDALAEYNSLKDERGAAKVYNNIGNLYQMVDYEKALSYFNQSLDIAQKFRDSSLIASLYLNMGNIYNRKNMNVSALNSYTKSYQLFEKLKNMPSLIFCLQDIGVIYYNQRDFGKAKEYLIKAHDKAKELDLNSSVAAINLTLTDLYVSEGNYAEAEKYLEEGRNYSQLIHNEKDIYDYKHTAYEMEIKRKNYKAALDNLINIYQEDSTSYRTNASIKFNFLQQEQSRLLAAVTQQKKDELTRVIFWSITITAGLLVVVIVLLVANVKRKATTNLQLQELNSEISRQKDNLDRINHHLEEIIDERTKDLQVKNKKLSEYSSYLSHQIRGPIATLKGLMNLEKEGLVDQLECINMMDKCVSEIDEKIIEMSDMLHDPGKTTL